MEATQTHIACASRLANRWTIGARAVWTRDLVTPYEHRGAEIRALVVRSSDDLAATIALFDAEPDRWLRKMLAQRILGSEHSDRVSPVVRNELQEALECRVIS